MIPETGRFRHDLHTADDVDCKELISEFRAQIERCIGILGRAPDICMGDGEPTVFCRAQKQVCREYGIVTEFTGHKIHFMDTEPAYREILTDSIWSSFRPFAFRMCMRCVLRS